MEYYSNDLDWIFNENPFAMNYHIPLFDNHGNFEFKFDGYSSLLPNQTIQFDKFEDFADMFSLDNNLEVQHPSNEIYCKVIVDVKPEIPTSFTSSDISSSLDFEEHESKVDMIKRKRKSGSSDQLGLEEIRRYFDMPIAQAAKEMNIGLTYLKRRCRELNVMRWPHRKIKSLECVIQNVKELGLENEVLELEEQRMLMKQEPEMELSSRTKKLRQACFKAKYTKKKNKSLIGFY
ncbi:hypothetical protein ACFE04_010100 [Oxalis oulophora]